MSTVLISQEKVLTLLDWMEGLYNWSRDDEENRPTPVQLVGDLEDIRYNLALVLAYLLGDDGEAAFENARAHLSHITEAQFNEIAEHLRDDEPD